MTNEVPEDQKLVCGLLDAYQAFSILEGENGAVASEAYRHLSSPELLPALRHFYQDAASEFNPTALAMRERLALTHKEAFGVPDGHANGEA
jgi:hypothetical protein